MVEVVPVAEMVMDHVAGKVDHKARLDSFKKSKSHKVCLMTMMMTTMKDSAAKSVPWRTDVMMTSVTPSTAFGISLLVSLLVVSASACAYNTNSSRCRNKMLCPKCHMELKCLMSQLLNHLALTGVRPRTIFL